MTDEKKETTTEETEPVWRTIEELLDEVGKVHFIEVKYRGRKLRFGWKELTDAEMIPPLSVETVQSKDVKERELLVSDWLKRDILKKIEKAGKIESCTNSNVLTLEMWDSLPKRIKNLIISESLETREGLMSDFLSA